ncbi:uncharacterized protein [Physcomitrium patens]|uniref:Uncharacterized protein n=1 Tax=Physcomitrium patens TaxID=3218 RepID=A9RZR4_PHYPA|nr:uncharacterized protein LOC112279804 [Physcomitrium patens]PNR61983.1 hypothetical protein PHYPA_000407 [Physcomitrium patens]|eukprot:XP_024370336.1 uncharacterized protein LOC112279804 [Physcomitrella patens]
MGTYQLSLQGSYSTQAEAAQKNSHGSTCCSGGKDGGISNGSCRAYSNGISTSSSYGCTRSSHTSGKKSAKSKVTHGFGLFGTKRVVSHQNLEGLVNASPSRHSTACCDGLAERQVHEKRLTAQRLDTRISAQDVDFVGSSFRSEDESLALWEEDEQPASTEHGGIKFTTQTPKWLEAMFDTVKHAPWRSSPGHPKSSSNSSRISLDRKTSTRPLHESPRALYSNSVKKNRNAENRAVCSPASASNLSRQSGELNLVSLPTYKHLDDAVTSDGSKYGSLSRLQEPDSISEEDMRLTSSADSWKTSFGLEPVTEKDCTVNRVTWEVPLSEAREIVEIERVQNAIPSLSMYGSASTTDSQDLAEEIAGTVDVLRSDAFDGRSEYASCRSSTEPELEHSDRVCDNTNTTESIGVGDLVNFIAPVISKPQTLERKETSSSSRSGRIVFKWEAPTGKVKAEEVFASTLQLDDSPYLTLFRQYSANLTSATVDGVPVILSKTSNSAIDTTSTSILTKSKFSHDFRGTRRIYSSRGADDSSDGLFTKKRPGMFGPTRSLMAERDGPRDFLDSSSPRSVLRGPGDGSLPSSNPSLRSDPGTPSFSPTVTSGSQSISSCNVSFDLGEGDCDALAPGYSPNSTAARTFVESRCVSLSFPSSCLEKPACDDASRKDNGTTTSNIELLGSDDPFNSNTLHSLPGPMHSPELWTATFSTRFCNNDSELDSFCAATERKSHCSTSPQDACQSSEDEHPNLEQNTRSRRDEFSAFPGMKFSPLRLTSSNKSNHSCFIATTLSPPHNDEHSNRSPTCAATLELLSPAGAYKQRKYKASGVKDTKLHFTKHQHSSEDEQTVMVSISKAMKKILSKCAVKRPTRKWKSKMGSLKSDILPPAKS